MERYLCKSVVEVWQLYQKMLKFIISVDGLLGSSSFYLVLKLHLLVK
jgi:hypothetical protein